MIESCWSCDDFQNVKLLFKLALSVYTFAPTIFKICIEKMSKQLPFYKEELVQTIKMISKVIGRLNSDIKFNNMLLMLNGLNTSLFGRSEERVINAFFVCFFCYFN